ncbi:hypothetical protein PoHVEF18_009847 [Penicillium ochrochloron]
MRLSAFPLAGLLFLGSLATATTDPLNYRNIAGYVASNTSTATTALGLIKSRSELSTLAEKIQELGGFAQAFDTNPNWKFTFFAPNNDAFESYTGVYFDTFETAPLASTVQELSMCRFVTADQFFSFHIRDIDPYGDDVGAKTMEHGPYEPQPREDISKITEYKLQVVLIAFTLAKFANLTMVCFELHDILPITSKSELRAVPRNNL